VILNNIDDEVLMHTTKELDISLASSEEACRAQITAIKAEEKLRASLAEAQYQAHMEKLKQREEIHDEVLDLSVIDNSKRDLESSPGSPKDPNAKKTRGKGGGARKRRNNRFMFWNIRGFGNPARRRQIR
jgi:hypothetical protein